MTQLLTPQKAAELLKELQYAKMQLGQLSIRDEYFKQALEKMVNAEKEEIMIGIVDIMSKEFAVTKQYEDYKLSSFSHWHCWSSWELVARKRVTK